MPIIIHILKYHRVKRDRWKWEHRHYDDLYSEIYDRLHKENPDALHENIREALDRTAECLHKKDVFCPEQEKRIPIKLYAMSPNTFTKYTHKTNKEKDAQNNPDANNETSNPDTNDPGAIRKGESTQSHAR